MNLRSVTILVDSREKRPLLFPSTVRWWPDRSSEGRLVQVKKRVRALDAGDYALEGHDEAGIERKLKLDELHTNLFTKDRKRAGLAFGRFAATFRVPYLLIEGTPAELWRPTAQVQRPARVFDEVVRLAARMNLRLWFAGGCKGAGPRRKLGEQVLHLLIAHTFSDQEIPEFNLDNLGDGGKNET